MRDFSESNRTPNYALQRTAPRVAELGVVRRHGVSRHKNNPQNKTNMKSQTLGLRVAGTIFALVCLGHLWRVVTRAEVLIAGHQLPLWMNIAGALIAGALSLWMWRLSATATR